MTTLPVLTDDTKATLLLTAPLLTGTRRARPKLLSTREYWRLKRELEKQDRSIRALVAAGARDAIDLSLPSGKLDKLDGLLQRGLQLADAADRWRERGIWAIGHADTEYPAALHDKLGDRAPPVLYGIGDPSLMTAGGLAIVGSRDADDDASEFARQVATEAATCGIQVVSGGARGIDSVAMRAALQAGGLVAGVLSQRLARAAVQAQNREALLERRLLLVSPFDPNAGFQVSNAMARNKVVYGLADAALIAASGRGKGGTWAGAMEELRRDNAMPVFVRDVPEPALVALHEHGARIWPGDGLIVETLTLAAGAA